MQTPEDVQAMLKLAWLGWMPSASAASWAAAATPFAVRRCWIAAIEAGKTAAEALHRHACNPELVGHAFVMLPLKRREVAA